VIVHALVEDRPAALTLLRDLAHAAGVVERVDVFEIGHADGIEAGLAKVLTAISPEMRASIAQRAAD
jgi:hypothetical protein